MSKEKAVLESETFPKEVCELILEFSDNYDMVAKKKKAQFIIQTAYAGWLHNRMTPEFTALRPTEYLCKEDIYLRPRFTEFWRLSAHASQIPVYEDMTISSLRFKLDYLHDPIQGFVFMDAFREFDRLLKL